ncbi:MAG: oxidoreductase [Cellvibrionales bacterium]|nr:MAG: oxidoreductase [Cellvibrionales bacterium]
MPKLLKNKTIVDNGWQVLPKDFDGVLPEAPCFVPLDYWLENKQNLQNPGAIGVWLDAEQEPEVLVEDIAGLQYLAVNFPTFMDGRGFSIGRLIRERYQFTGELRAIGHIVPDQLFYLSRCGFDAFCLDALALDHAAEENHKLEDYLATFSVTYQACVNEQQPLFRRRQA